MRDRLRSNVRHHDRFETSRDAQLRFRIAQPVEHHHAQQTLGVELAIRSQHSTERIGKAQFLPQRSEHPGVANRQARHKGGLAGALIERRVARRTQQPVDQCFVTAGL